MAVIFQLGIDDTSPTISYNPSLENITAPSLFAGWVPSYSLSGSASTPGQIGEGTSLHVTSFDGATLSITWSGPGIELYGNATQASYAATLDGTAVNNITSSASINANLLVGFDGLSNDQHTITLTAHTLSTSSSFLAFDRAVITASVDVISANMSSQPVEDSTISFQGQWSYGCDSLSGSCFHVSNKSGDASHLNFTGTAVAVSGLRDFTFGRYNVSLDGETSQFDAQSTWREETVLFFKTGLDPDASHALIITNAENQSLAVGAINVTTISRGTIIGSNSGLPKGTIAALVMGIVLGLLVISGLVYLFWRRRRAKFIKPQIQKSQVTDVVDIHEEEDDDEDNKGSPASPNSRFSLKFAPNPALAFQGQQKPAPLNLPRSPTSSSPSSQSQHLRDTSRGSRLHHIESSDPLSYLSVNIRSPVQVEFQNVPRSERRNSIRPVGPREQPRQDSKEPPPQELPQVHITPSPTEVIGNNTFSFLDFNSSPSSSLHNPSRDSQQSQSQPPPQSRSQSRISGSGSTPSPTPKRNSEQSRSSLGPLSFSTALQQPNTKIERQATAHPYSHSTSQNLVIPNPNILQEVSPTESVPMTVSEIHFREMNVSDHNLSRRTSGSHPGWHPPPPHTAPPTKQSFGSSAIVQKLFGPKPQALDQRRTRHRQSFSTSILLPRAQNG